MNTHKTSAEKPECAAKRNKCPRLEDPNNNEDTGSNDADVVVVEDTIDIDLTQDQEPSPEAQVNAASDDLVKMRADLWFAGAWLAEGR